MYVVWGIVCRNINVYYGHVNKWPLHSQLRLCNGLSVTDYADLFVSVCLRVTN